MDRISRGGQMLPRVRYLDAIRCRYIRPISCAGRSEIIASDRGAHRSVEDTRARPSLVSSLPLLCSGHPAEIDEIFDAISYSKGSSVIRMLHDYIGDDAFRKGLHNYLTEYSYKNTVTENLWSHLSKASGKPVNDVMSSWTLQMVR